MFHYFHLAARFVNVSNRCGDYFYPPIGYELSNEIIFNLDFLTFLVELFAGFFPLKVL